MAFKGSSVYCSRTFTTGAETYTVVSVTGSGAIQSINFIGSSGTDAAIYIDGVRRIRWTGNTDSGFQLPIRFEQSLVVKAESDATLFRVFYFLD